MKKNSKRSPDLGDDCEINFDKVLNKTALSMMALDQYANTTLAQKRFIDAIHTESMPLDRAASEPGRMKHIFDEELNLDKYDYFLEVQEDVSEEFYSELVAGIGTEQACLFIETIAKYWFDSGKHQSAKVVGLKRAIHDYMVSVSSQQPFVSKPEATSFSKPSTFNKNEIEFILALNDQFMYQHIHCWLESHENGLQMGLADVFLRRGINLSKLFEDGHIFNEWDYINSYSLATTLTEQFTYLGKGKHKVMLSSDFSLFNGRILFFAPFINGMNTNQLEVGIIPSTTPLVLIYQGCHNKIDEYRIVDKAKEDFVRKSYQFTQGW